MVISTDMLYRVMKVRREKSSAERVRERKRYEDAAIAIIDENFGKLKEWHIEKILDFLNMDIQDGTFRRDRFMPLFSEPNRRRLLRNPLDLLNELFIEIYWKENLDAADDLMARLDGVGEGLVSCLLYLKDRDRYNIMLDATVRGIELVFGESIGGKTFREKYEKFNELANKLKRLCKLEPQEMDLVLWAIAK